MHGKLGFCNAHVEEAMAESVRAIGQGLSGDVPVGASHYKPLNYRRFHMQSWHGINGHITTVYSEAELPVQSQFACRG
jgi:hypothetical protein